MSPAIYDIAVRNQQKNPLPPPLQKSALKRKRALTHLAATSNKTGKIQFQFNER